MDKLVNIFMAPSKVFTSLKEQPQWILPFIVVLVVIAIIAAATVSLTRGMVAVPQREALEQRDMSEEQIEQALKFTQGPLAMIGGAIGAAIVTAIILLIFSAILNLFIPVFGGTSLFKNIFSVVCFSALIKIPSAILRLILIAITKSLYASTSLALFVPNLAKHSFGFQLLAGFDFFIIWEMLLVALGISITNEIKKTNAYILVFLIWIVSLLIVSVLGSIFRLV